MFLAKCNYSNVKVAIKYVDLTDANQALMRFMCREVKINQNLSAINNNVFTPKLLDLYMPQCDKESDQSQLTGIYMVFEYMPYTLLDVINSPQKLTENQVLIFTYNFLCAMKFIHKCNLVHRDLKPSNILITESMEVRIADFGLSRSVESLKSSQYGKLRRQMSCTCFTRYYRPPEVILASNNFDQSADVWSMGCILYEILQKSENSLKVP